MKYVVTILGLAVLLAAAFVFYRGSDQAAWSEYFSGEHAHSAAEHEAEEIDYWTCAMHPSVRMTEPGQCPICGMDLVPVRRRPPVNQEEVPPPGIAPPEGSGEPAEAPSPPVDSSTFEVSPRRQQLINMQTETVAVRPLEKTIRTVAILKLDETRIRYVHPKISGWIDRVFVDFALQHVRQGDPLFSVYSPQLVATQEEYLLAVRAAEQMGQSSFDFVSDGARSLLLATRRRLELFDVTEEQIRELEKTGRVQKSLLIHSPVSGHVIDRNAFENMRVTPETRVYAVADHTRIWAQVEIYENDIPYVFLDQPVTMRVPAFPGETFRGSVAFVSPHLNGKTRTMEARLEFPNPDLRFKPEMYADIELHVSMGELLAVPESAVLRTGARDLVFVDLGEGRMQLRRVEVGIKAGDYYQVLRGLEEGERVVSAANFLIDAESRIQGVEASWETPRPGDGRAPAP